MKLDVKTFDMVLDETWQGRTGPLDEASATELMRQMMKRVFERALRGELTHQLGYEKHAVAGYGSGNSRNGTSPTKTSPPPPGLAPLAEECGEVWARAGECIDK